jgi:hypothetical protein
MRATRALLLVGAVVLGVVMFGLPGAAKTSGETDQLVQKALTRMNAGGVSVEDVVVQDGDRNYAGPDCPGSGWECTTARFVVQISAGINESECESGEPCVIVQESDGGTNVARCLQKSQQLYESSQQVTQVCDITQKNTTGKNTAIVKQTIYQKTKKKQQYAVQQTHIEQLNVTGTNAVSGSQAVTQEAKSEPSEEQEQNDHQVYAVNQNASTGANNQSWRQSLVQIAEMSSAYDVSTSGYGSSSSQTQSGLLEGFVDQKSDGVSTGDNKQSGTQKMSAPPDTVQIQDPRVRCCSDQTGNEDDVFKIDQEFVQIASNPKRQFAEDVGRCETSGTCTITQRARQNDVKKKNFVSGTGLVTASIVCRGQGSVNKCVVKSNVDDKIY